MTVDQDGKARARRLDNNQRSRVWSVGYTGLDKQLIRLFERWLTVRDRDWRDDEIRVFGSLLHRCLFGNDNWEWIQAIIEDSPRVRLELIFPDDSRLAALPWEYLYLPDKDRRQGAFLATRRNLVLSRYIPLRGRQFSAQDKLTVLVVISQPKDPRIGPVKYEDVLETINATAATLNFKTLETLHNPTEQDLARAVRTGSPDLIHFMGHGKFDEDRGAGALALVDPDGGVDWVSDRRIADTLTRYGNIPRAVVLHSCDAGKADYEASFAGVAPQLIRHGVQSVIAMQYPVRNSTAIKFSSGLYNALANGDDLDVAAQEARFQISGSAPHLLGVPVVYMQSSTPLLRSRSGDL
ncbi:hypothetical protein [Alloactinosynnema sp. L-07]|nr:hypothetical protein [Alloactinosynnema sp. L-07]